ncbi:WD40 repeat domain-containing serine/threonine protein kinase [Microtetraspora fusca]|uniref:WD40 repeat domain-containing serine/threonine protein kinase n=1 Tax=Microtetraspora fusca TaxID=1997 RepID=A0ABW6V9Y1_MICFU|nr:WD40 repeat domain-containing serine/threonine protein kinase [Microtetraspora fusca]
MEALIPGDPQRLGEYWLAGRLGAGGQGVVYEAYAENGTRVAIKVLHGDQAAQLAKEAAAAQRVSSFCTARVIEAELDGPRPYLVSEYVPGPSLRKAVAEGRRFHDGDLHRLATAVATALTAIHGAGVVHRDLKPDNVLLGPDGPRVIDFGIARTAEMSLTATGLVTGTPTYMAPEVFSGQRAGQPADVFAWGGITFYAATGADPFEAESLGGVMHRVLSSNPDLSALPELMRPLVSAALMKDPRERPSARQLLLALVSGDSRLDTARLLAQGGRTAAQMAGPGDDPALGTLAEESYALLGPAERELVPEVLLRLVTVGERDELAVRHAGMAELVEGRPAPEVAAITRIMEVFGYLLGRDQQEVWLAHPALPHAWPRLRRWIEANRDGLAAHRQIRNAAQQWEEAGRKDGDLLQSTSLDGALQWAATYRRNITLSPVERDFLESSVRVTRRRARRARLVTLSLAGLLVIALTGGGLAVWQGKEADAKAEELATALRRSESIRLAALADATRRTDPRLGLLLSVAAWRLAGTTQARTALNGALAQREQAMFRDSGGGAGALTYFAADGRTLVSLRGGLARLLDVRSGRQVAAVTGLDLGGGPVTDLALTPSGRTLLVANDERAGAWDVRTGEAVGTWPTPRVSDRITRWAEAVARNEGTRVSVRAGHQWEVVPAELSSRTGVVSPDGRWRASHVRGRLVLADLRKGSAQGPGEGIDDNGDAVFSRNGRLLATVSRASIRFWRLPGLQPLTKAQVRGDGDAAVRPIGAFDGSTFRYLMGDQVFSLDVADLTAEAGREPVSRAVLSGDGRYLVVSNADDAITVRSLATGKDLPTMPGPVAFAFSPDSRMAVVHEGRTKVLDPATGKVLADFAAGEQSWEVAFSPDGRRLALLLPAGVGHAVELWDWAARRRLWRTPTAEPKALAFSPDGRRLAVVGRDQRLLDTASGVPIGEPFGEIGAGESGRQAWFTRSGTILIVHDSRGRITRWDTATRRSVGLPVRGVFGTGAAYSPAEDLIAFPQSQGRVLLFDPLSGSSLGRSADTGGGLDPATGQVWSAAFSPDGSRVLTVDGHATVRSFPGAPETAAQAACTRAGRSLTRQEWAEHVPALPYLEVCPR